MKHTIISFLLFCVSSCQPCLSANGGARPGAQNVLFQHVSIANHSNGNTLTGGARVGPKSEILAAIIHVESKGDSQAINRSENAVGLLQIRPILVAECNRILKKQGSPVRYTVDDRWTPERSIEMFTIYQNYWNPTWDAETAARLWQGGSNFKRTPRNNAYWQKVRRQL